MICCEFCAKEIEPDSLWMSGEACYCSSRCRKDGQLAAHGDAVERNAITRWGEGHEARMARLKAAADADMELDRENTLWAS